jgi:biopolymer transport protein ExbD
MKLLRRTCRRGRIEIIPMIDTILILLIFYMSFSSFKRSEQRLDAKLQQISSNRTQSVVGLRELPPIVLHVFDHHRVELNGLTTLDVDNLRAVLVQATDAGLEPRVVIEAEPTTRYEHVVSTLDACAAAHLTRVGFVPARGR